MNLERQLEAVRWMLDRLSTQGRKWYRNAKLAGNSPFDDCVSPNFSFFDGTQIHEIGRRPSGSFPKRKILLTQPFRNEKSAVAGFWLRWNFERNPMEFRLFLGYWFRADGKRKFNGYRFDTPEEGEEHDYFHCQPCRNFGDKESLPEAAIVSERFPTIPVDASNIVELTVCGLMAAMGRKKMKRFLHQLMASGSYSENEFLKEAYLRCVKK